MTIHSVLRNTATTPHLSGAASAATNLEGVERLLHALGICTETGFAETVDHELHHEIRVTHRIEGSGTLVILLAELDKPATAARIAAVSVSVRRLEPIRPLVVAIIGPDYVTITLACFSGNGDVRHFTFEPAALVSSDLDVLSDVLAAPGEPGLSITLRMASAFDNKAVTNRFFTEIRAHRDRIASAWLGIPTNLVNEREQLSLLLQCRLMFLYFLQRQGHLLGEKRFLITRVRNWQREGEGDSLYHDVLIPLFFNALNTRPEKRTAATLRLGNLPYLNGGLFERNALERRYPELDLPSRYLIDLFDGLLEAFRFTATDAGDARNGVAISGIDPEILGRVFEGLMTSEKRSTTGSFYTPPHMVDLLTRETLRVHLQDHALVNDDVAAQILSPDGSEIANKVRHRASCVLREARIVDPACGSGAFLLGGLSLLGAARAGLGEPLSAARRDIVQNTLHGVDLLEEAALLCSLRLWLALADDGGVPTQPLPNLDRRIRQGDSLLDPLELLAPRCGTDADARALRDRTVRTLLKSLQPVSTRYVDADPEERLALREHLRSAERDLACAWASAVDTRLERTLKEIVARADTRDLWGMETPAAIRARHSIARLNARKVESTNLLRNLDTSAALPFFSFRVHFAEQEHFNIVLSNPPWVRAHKWPRTIGAVVRDRYQVARGSGQVDLSSLFVERSLGLLSDGGTMGMLLPAKFLRSRHAGGVRALLDSEARMRFIDDYSLDHRSVFRADAFTTAIVATKTGVKRNDGSAPKGASSMIRVRMSRRGVAPLQFHVSPESLRLRPGDARSPWLLAPPDVIGVMRKMMHGNTTVASDPSLRIGRGVVTGANDVLVVRESVPKLGSLSHIRAEGYFQSRKLSHSTSASRKYVAFVETGALRPLLRGCDVDAWNAMASARVIWVSGDKNQARHPRLARYLARHEDALRARTGVSVNAPLGSIMRVSDATLGHKVVWRDISSALCAAAVPDRVKGDDGRDVAIVPLNTLYFVGTPDRETALLLSAYLNSLPLRVFARAIAERAKDAHFRFFACTVGSLPLPTDWIERSSAQLVDHSRKAHEARGISTGDQAILDQIVCDMYGLSAADFATLASFDHWLSGRK
jgi:hypothetical protein